MPSPLYVPHGRALTLLFSDVENHALATSEVFTGTAGSVIERSNAGGFRFYAHQFYDGDGLRRERYLAGPVGAPEADRIAAELGARIGDLKQLVPSLRLLGREGYNLVDSRTFAALASLSNHGVFAAGGLLIGSHAFGVILNRLGARVAPYATEDIDIARREPLSFAGPPSSSFADMLRASGLDFVDVPALDRKAPPTSWKQRGRSRFQVDLLVPARGETFPVVPVRELGAWATGLPHLDYLLAESQMTALLAREGCCAVRVPVPERFAVHKLLVSQRRTGQDAKAKKDLAQAAALCAALSDAHPGAIESALAAAPRSARKFIRGGIAAARALLAPHPRAIEELGG